MRKNHTRQLQEPINNGLKSFNRKIIVGILKPDTFSKGFQKFLRGCDKTIKRSERILKKETQSFGDNLLLSWKSI